MTQPNDTPDVIAPFVPDAPTDAPMTLTAEDLRQVRNACVSAITHHPDVLTFLDARIAAGLQTAGVLTNANVHESAGLFARVEETGYEAGRHAIHDDPEIDAIETKLGITPSK